MVMHQIMKLIIKSKSFKFTVEEVPGFPFGECSWGFAAVCETPSEHRAYGQTRPQSADEGNQSVAETQPL